MFRFEHSEYLLLLWLIPILIFWEIRNKKKREALYNKWKNVDLLKSLLNNYFPDLDKWKIPLLIAGIASLIIAYANPQLGQRDENVKKSAANIYIALDISKSMTAQDLLPNRLERAKKYTCDLITNLKGNNIGLIFFAGSAYLQMPLTSDYAAAIMMVNAASTESAGTQGTDIGEIANLIKRVNQKQQAPASHLIIITDGEDNEERGVQSIKELAELGITTYCIGVGTEQGATLLESGQLKIDPATNKPIISKMNPELINDIAKAGNGRAFALDDNAAFSLIAQDLEDEAKTTNTSKSVKEYISYFQWFVLLALIIFAIEFYLSKKQYLIK